MKRFQVVIVILVLSTALFHWVSVPDVSLPRSNFNTFPQNIGPWSTVHSQQIGQGSMEVLRVDDYAFRTYVNPSGKTVELYIGYYRRQTEGKLIHSPRQCLPGSGYTLISHEVHFLPHKKYGQVPVNVNLMQKGRDIELYIWWYQGRGRIYANEYLNKVYLITDAILLHRSDGALVRVHTSVGTDRDESHKILLEFIEHLFSLLPDYIPE